MRSPVGVILDMDPTTEVHWYDAETGTVNATGMAPQLSVTKYAADPASYIWKCSPKPTEMAEAMFRPVYETGGLELSDTHNMTVRVYKELPVATSSDLQTEKITQVAGPTATPEEKPRPVDGFWVGKAAANGTLTLNSDGRVTEDSNEQAEDTRQDAVTSGIAIKSFLYDQYDIAFEDKKSELTLWTQADIDAEAAAKSRGEAFVDHSPFEVVPVNGKIGSYTIKYKSGMGINDVEEGEYVLRAVYDVIREPKVEADPPKTLYVKKPEDRLSYIKTTFVGDGAVGAPQKVVENGVEGEIIEVVCDVPERIGKTLVSKTPTIRIDELANQWREPDDSLETEQIQNYDIVSGIRESAGSAGINIIKARTEGIQIGIERIYEGSEDNGPAPRGITFGVYKKVGAKTQFVPLSESGQFTYTSDVLHDTQFTCRITATYEGESRFVEYRFRFVRKLDNLKLSGIVVTPPTDPNSDHIRVPLPSEKENTVQIQLVMKDQYNSDLDQDYVLEAYRPGGTMNSNPDPAQGYWPDWPEWGVYLYPSSTLPDGVLLDHDKNTITVTSAAADESTFQIYAKLGTTESDPVTVRVSRDGSKPNTVSDITYSKKSGSNMELVTELESPGKNSATENEYFPSVTVTNQYNRVLEPQRLLPEQRGYYKPTWTISKVTPASAKDYLAIDEFTGQLTVKRCAPNCTVTVKLTAATRYGTNSNTITLEVKRREAVPETLTLVETEAPYPTTDEKLDDPQSAYVPLTVKGTTQYGDDQVFKHGEGDGSVALTWTLDQVEFKGPGPNGEKDSNGHYTLYRQKLNSGTGNMENTGDITDSAGSWAAWNSLELSKSGVLLFLDITQREKLPLFVWVTVTYGTGTNAVTTGKHKIEITWDTKDVPQQIQIAETYKYTGGVEIPRADAPTELPLQGEVRNQYGVVIDTPVEWTAAEAVKGMKLLKRADGSYAVQVDYTAVKGSTLRLTAKCTEAPNVTVDLPITVIGNNEPLEVDSVVMTGMRDSTGKTLPLETEGGVPEITIPLPAKTGKGYDTYKIVCNVLSQFRHPMSGEVDWTIDAPEGVTVTFLDDSKETVKDIRISFTEEARNALLGDPVAGDVKFTIHASCQGKPDPSDTEKQKESTCVVRFELADPQIAYAAPQVTDYGDFFEETVGGVVTKKPRVPEWGKEPTKVTLKAVVYDQYGVEMPGEAAELQLLTLDPSLTLTGNVLSISSSFIGNLVTIQATPKDMPQAVWTESQKLIETYADPAYPFGLKIGENSVFDTDIHYEHVAIPVWESYTIYVKDEDTAITMPLEAKVVNQREGVFDWDSSLYPIWEFAGDHVGVEFDNPELDDAGNVKGSAIALKITNQAAQSIPNGQSECVVTLKVSTNGKSGGNFEKLVKVHLTRNRRTPTYMYIDGSDENGEDKTGLKRPYAEDKTTEYQFEPVVYDQYGQPLELPVDMDLDLEALKDLPHVRAEKIYKRGESEDKGNSPIAYEIYWVEQEATETEKAKEMLIGEFSRETGMVKLYTVCSSELLPSLKLNAKYGDLPLKSLRVYNVQEDSIPYTVKVNRSHGDFVISGKGEPISDYITPAVYDQYGQALPFNRLLNIQWALYMPEKDETGAYVPYADYDKDGHEKLKADWLILHKETAAQTYSTVLTVQPEQFTENKSAILQCVVSYIQYVDGVRKVKTLPKDTLIRVNRPASGGGGIIVTFDAGEYGKLVGESQMELSLGETPNAPGVKTITGYGFIGWTTNGENILDAGQIPLFEDTAYVAVYKDITNTKFLEGYKDGTVRPEVAVTRAEFVTMLARAMGGYDGSKDYGASYPDVAKGKWYANYIAYAKQKGLTSGYPDGTFRPNSPITRAEAARLLTVAAELPAGKTGTFSDVKEGAWYTGAIESLAAAGIASGYPDGTYRPDRHITRAEAVRLIVMMTENALDDLQRKNIQEYAYCPFSDIKKGHWAYAYILRAAGVA